MNESLQVQNPRPLKDTGELCLKHTPHTKVCTVQVMHRWLCRFSVIEVMVVLRT